MRKILAAGLCLLAGCALAWAQVPAVPLPSVFEPASSGGVETVDRALAKLSTHRRMMMIGAHPDDEGNSLMALVARGLGGEAAYLSLSRGEGGQNLVGPELGLGLGLIRTGELLGARGVDGGRQFFTRAYDFGYTRSLDEALRRWPREAMLEDAVRAVRRFRPQVIVSVFPPDSRAGHGQHQASGVIGAEMYEAAGLPDRFPALTGDGLGPWNPQAFYRRAWWDREEITLQQEVGWLEPLSGRSILQLAAESRSMHRSQDMGRIQPIGPREAGLGWVAGGAGREGDDLFAGIDTRLAAIAATLSEGELRTAVEASLLRVEEIARATLEIISPQHLDRAAAPLAEILGELATARDALIAAVADDAEAIELRGVLSLIAEKIEIAQVGLAASAGIVVDAIAESETFVVGGTKKVTVSLWNGGDLDLDAQDVRLISPEGWQASASELEDSAQPHGPAQVDPGRMSQWTFDVSVPASSRPTLPYFLLEERDGDLYRWGGEIAPEVRGEPYQPPPLTAVLEVRLGETPVRLAREVVYRFADQAIGEIRKPLRAVPELEVEVGPRLVVWPLGSAHKPEIEIGVRSHLDHPVAGRLAVDLPEGWSTSCALEFAIDEALGAQLVRCALEPPTMVGAGRFEVAVSATLAGGSTFDRAYPLVDYSHIRAVTFSEPATVTVQALEMELPSLQRVGYVRGASDRIPEVLAEVGIEVDLLTGADLAHTDLGAFEVIVVGPRAYETDAGLLRSNRRLLDFVEAGGTLLVQYQQYQFSRGGYAPLTLEIARPHDRVTDETSPVRLLEPEHPVFVQPNRIGPGDWEGWVQERGLYFAHTWDEAYLPLLGLKDPDRPEQSGALLVASYGEGIYVYSGLSFFRELPAGVPGAYRLFANLLALGEKE